MEVMRGTHLHVWSHFIHIVLTNSQEKCWPRIWPRRLFEACVGCVPFWKSEQTFNVHASPVLRPYTKKTSRRRSAATDICDLSFHERIRAANTSRTFHLARNSRARTITHMTIYGNVAFYTNIYACFTKNCLNGGYDLFLYDCYF